jgi:hypothetical protein
VESARKTAAACSTEWRRRHGRALLEAELKFSDRQCRLTQPRNLEGRANAHARKTKRDNVAHVKRHPAEAQAARADARGDPAGVEDGQVIDIELAARGGGVTRIRVDRETGGILE